MARYDDEFRAAAVREWRERADPTEPLSSVANRLGIASSTLMRWDTAVRQAPPYKDPVQDVLERLGRGNASTRAHFDRQRAHYERSVRYYRVFGTILVLPIYALVFLAMLSPFLLIPSDPFWVQITVAAIFLALVFVLVAIFNWISEGVANYLGAFVMATSALVLAYRILTSDLKDVPLEPPWWHLSQRRRWRSFHKYLRRAESHLTRRTTLGRAFRTTSARDWELMHRQRIAASIGFAEVQIHMGGSDARERCGRLIDEIFILTVLRDWSLEDLDRLPETAAQFQSRRSVATRRLVAALPLLVGIIALVQGVPDVADVFQELWP